LNSAQLEKMVKGWFVGDFEPTMLRTSAVEVAVKHYRAGESEPRHHHLIATELTVIVSGSVKMNGKVFREGSIISIAPRESTDFEALQACTTVVVKFPGAGNDKYAGDFDD
jgi:anti-sigma factor ChrR (cupin superfamily)